jgi:hypothetical protein
VVGRREIALAIGTVASEMPHESGLGGRGFGCGSRSPDKVRANGAPVVGERVGGVPPKPPQREIGCQHDARWAAVDAPQHHPATRRARREQPADAPRQPAGPSP